MAAPEDLPFRNSIHDVLGIDVVEAGVDRVVLQMDVTPKVHQPMGQLHGGASAVICESAASIGAFLNCDPSREYAVGTDLNISHLRAKREGTVRATATPVRKGRSLHVWQIDLRDEDEALVAVARCTLAVRRIPS